MPADGPRRQSYFGSGYTKDEGIYYTETDRPVRKVTTIGVLLTLVISRAWSILICA